MNIGLSILFSVYCWITAECMILNAVNKSEDSQQEYRPEGPLVMCKYL